jgi:hypothetical protein
MDARVKPAHDEKVAARLPVLRLHNNGPREAKIPRGRGKLTKCFPAFIA